MKKFRRDVFGVVNAGVNTFKEYFDTFTDANGTINYAGQRYVASHINIFTDTKGNLYPTWDIAAYMAISCMNNHGVVSPYTCEPSGMFAYGGVWINRINYTTCDNTTLNPAAASNNWYYCVCTQNGINAINQSNYEINRTIGTSISVIGKHLFADESIQDPITRTNELIKEQSKERYEIFNASAPSCHINLKACIICDPVDHSHDKIILGFDTNDINNISLIDAALKKSNTGYTSSKAIVASIIRSIGIESNEVLYSRNTPELSSYNPVIKSAFDAYANSAPDWDGLYVLPCTDSNIRMVLEIIRCGGFFNMISKEESDDILKRFDSACTPDQDVIDGIKKRYEYGGLKLAEPFAKEHGIGAMNYLTNIYNNDLETVRIAKELFDSNIAFFKECYTISSEDVANKYWESLSKKDPDKYTDELKHEIIKKIHESDTIMKPLLDSQL